MVSVIRYFNSTCSVCHKARWLIMAVAGLAFISWGLLGWYQLAIWYKDTAPVVQFGQGSISDHTVKTYQSVVIKQPMTKLRDCPGQIQRIISGECGSHVLYEGQATVQAGFDGQMILPFSVPDTLIPGQCAFQIHARFTCNSVDKWLHRQVYQSPPIEFVVGE